MAQLSLSTHHCRRILNCRRVLYFLFCLTLLCPLVARSADQEARSLYRHTEFSIDYFRSYMDDAKSLITAPTQWQKEEWLKFSAVAGTAAALLAFDRDIQKKIQGGKLDRWSPDYEEEWEERLTNLAKPFGGHELLIPTLAGLYIYGGLTDDLRAKSTVLVSVESLFFSTVITQFMKSAINRERPSGKGIYHNWNASSQSDPEKSMPSGHAASAFTVATVVASTYSDVPLVPLTAYSIATLVALQRPTDNRHWASDVFVGAAIGHFVSKTILSLNEREQTDLRIEPYLAGDATGIKFSLQY